MSFKYRSKPVEIEAVSVETLEAMCKGTATVAICSWGVRAAIDGIVFTDNAGKNWCKTKQGDVQINDGDMLIKLADGEIYPCNPETFAGKYESLDSTDSFRFIIYDEDGSLRGTNDGALADAIAAVEETSVIFDCDNRKTLDDITITPATWADVEGDDEPGSPAIGDKDD